MKNKLFLILLAIANFSIDTICQTQKPRSKGTDGRPNIIFILTDDQRWDALGYAGNDIISTPEMDKLAKEGIFFRNAFVTTPICAASRASIFTGLHERTHKYTFQTGPLQTQYLQTAYPKLLREAGYHTGFYGKFGVNCPGKEAMFDVIEDYDRNNLYKDYRGYFYMTLYGDTVHLTRYTGQKALEFIEDIPEGKPFCLSLSFSAPHAHDGAPEQYFWQDEPGKLYQDMDIPGPELADDTYFQALPQEVREGFNRLRWTWRFDTPEKYQHSVKGYYRMIKGIDLEIALIRKRLREKGLDKNTVIILMGDNGYFLGERQLAGKWLMYDNSIRVPLIVHDPRSKTHLDIHEMALNIDVPATILDLAGLEIPDSFQGISLMPLVSQQNNTINRDTILIEHLWEFEHIPPSEGVRTDRWKYMRYMNDKSLEELYDLNADPKEAVNLAKEDQYQPVLIDLQHKLDILAKRFADPYSGAPGGLTVEYIREPALVKIVDPKPEFAWEVPQAAGYQQAFQLLVSSSKKLIDKNIGNMWDSGQVRSDQSINVEYKGKPLNEHTAYFWKVRIFDKDNRLTEYSVPQKFNTGEFGEQVTTANLFQIEKIVAQKFVEADDGSYFIDFGKAAFGTLELEYKSTDDEVLTIRLGEKLLDGRIDREPGGSIRYAQVDVRVTPDQSDYVIQLVPDQRNTNEKAVQLPDSFDVVMPFRYVEIENALQPITSKNVFQKAYFHFFNDNLSSFHSSDTILNQLWELCKYSMKATSFTGLYIDGDRERIPYEADAYINQLSHYAVDKEYAIGRRTIEYFMKHPTWPTEWQLHVALMFYQDYMYTGDTELIEKYYESIKHKTLMALVNDDGLISTLSPMHNGQLMADLGFADTTERLRDIVDWPPAQKDTDWELPKDWPQGERDGFEFKPFNTVINSFYYQNMKIMSEFASILNKPEESLDFEIRALKAKKAINEKLFDRGKAYYLDGIGANNGSVHANMLPLAFDIVPEEHVASVVNHIKSRGMGCSVYGAQFLMEGLYNAGAADYALDLMTATHDRSWYNMIRIGSTITLEAWDMRYKPNADWNHAWGAVPGNIIQRYLWGIQPRTPGFGEVIIKPQLSEIDEASIVVPTVRGNIKGAYQKVNVRLQKFTIELPANMVGEFDISLFQDVVITLNGRIINPAFKEVRLSPGINEIELSINSF